MGELAVPLLYLSGEEEEKHRIYLFFGVKVGELLAEPTKSTADSVPENLPFHFHPDTIRNGATRQRRRGGSCNPFQIAI